MKIAWVIGGGGLLGSSIANQLLKQGVTLFKTNKNFQWSYKKELHSQFKNEIYKFIDDIKYYDSWEIYWAAGISNMHSSNTQLISETDTLDNFFTILLSTNLDNSKPGSFIFSSSAGAIYGDNGGLVNEDSKETPSTNYGKFKLKQEKRLIEGINNAKNIKLFIARLTTLYGPKQSKGKNQGLVTEIIRKTIENRPLHIYVPMDTSRDYLFSKDAAAGLCQLWTEGLDNDHKFFIRIIASESSTTIAQIISICSKVLKRRPKILTSSNEKATAYKMKSAYRSKFQNINIRKNRTNIIAGLHQLLKDELIAYKARSRK